MARRLRPLASLRRHGRDRGGNLLAKIQHGIFRRNRIASIRRFNLRPVQTQMKSKLTITGALVLALAMTPHSRSSAQQKPQWVIPVVCGMIVIGIGAWVGYELVQVCKNIPPPPKPDDQPDPPPPPGAPNVAQFTPSTTNSPTVTMVLDDSSGVALWDATSYGWTDPVSGDPVTAIMTTRVQSTADFHVWNDEVSLRGYCSQAGITMVYSRAGSPICTNYLAAGATNVLNLLQGKAAPFKFYRLAAP